MAEHDDQVYFEFGGDMAASTEPEFNFDDLKNPPMLFVGNVGEGVSLSMALAHIANTETLSRETVVIDALNADHDRANDLYIMAN